MKYPKKLLGLFSVMIVVLAGCGGGSTPISDSPASTTNASTNNSGTTSGTPTVAGVFKGTYTTNVITSLTPFTLTLAQNGTSATGTFASTKIFGAAAGTLSGNTLTLVVTEPNNGGSVTITGSYNSTAGTMSIGKITGVDTFGNNTTGSGSCTAQASAPPPQFPSSYNGFAILENESGLPGANANGVAPFAPTSGTYPLSVTGLTPDGSGNYAGAFTSNFLSGIISLAWFSAGSEYSFLIYPKGDFEWFAGNQGAVSLAGTQSFYRVDNASAAYVTSNMTFHPGNIHSDLTGTWNLVSSSSTAIKGLTLAITTADGTNFNAIANGTVEESASASLDTVSGELQGIYDLLPHPNIKVTNNGYPSGYAIAFTAGTPLSITNASGLTSTFTVYFSWVDTSTNTISVDIDTGSNVFRNVLLQKQ